MGHTVLLWCTEGSPKLVRVCHRQHSKESLNHSTTGPSTSPNFWRWPSPGTLSATLNPQTGGSHVRVSVRLKTDPLLCAPCPPSYPEPFLVPADHPAPNPPSSSPAAAPGNRDAQGQRVRPAALRGAGGRTGQSGTASGMSTLAPAPAAPVGSGEWSRSTARCGARGCSAPPRPRPDSEPRARQPRGPTRRAGAPEPREPCGGSARPYCRCGAGTGTEDGGARAEDGKACGSRPDAPMPRCRARPRCPDPPLIPPNPAARPRQSTARGAAPGRGALSAGAAPPPDAAVVPIPCPCHTCWRGAGRDAASPPAASCCPRRCAAPPGGERGGGRRDRPAARALKRQRHRTPSAVLRPLLVPAGTGPGSRLQAPAAMSLHSAPWPRPLSWCPPAPPPPDARRAPKTRFTSQTQHQEPPVHPTM